MKTLSLFIILTFVLLQYSCTEDYSNRETVYIDQDTKDFTVFKPGTWWLYKNLKNNVNDTWKMFFTENYIILPGKTVPNNVERIVLKVSTISRDTFKILITVNNADFATSKFNGSNQICYFNSHLNISSSCDNNYIRLISSDTLNGKSIRKEFDYSPTPCTNIFPNYFVWERHKGLTKMAYPNGDTLVLIDQNIIQ